MNELYVRVLPNCCGYTLCVDICPEIFQLDASGFAVTSSDGVPGELQQRAVEAVESCPQGAIESSGVPFA